MSYVIKSVQVMGEFVSVELKPTTGVLGDGSGGPGDYVCVTVPYGTPQAVLTAVDTEVKRRDMEAQKSAELTAALASKIVGHTGNTTTIT